MAAPTPSQEPHAITALLRQAASGHRGALDELLPLVYDQLSGMAHARLLHESPGHTLETAGLVHEAWLRLINQHRAEWQDRRHFFAVASEAMRRILVDHARKRRSAKRGGPAMHLPLDAADALGTAPLADADDTLIALDSALSRLATFNAAGADVVQYRFFAGLTMPEVAEQMGISERTARRSWSAARAWLRREVVRAGGAP
ncbi:MAG: sigma-70 family RNA polymerase sigma factor [Gemmatimonadetes bacterium]|nr:sigma-70 family RNA polymerase sigma factor [Gemmatimonadota bacterium]MCA9763073.1 sigma-70 family RNA polymerase sigma factor [Gemmatimonadota bacterium]MCA9767697.1 sigma-70 family RNA polymerase sigma factor [Gemmatimonadota bacterium]MCB9505556.1 sigma-70 family RNA polymerase sigma factor [Gemmatimonadales bacterium]